MRKASRKGDTEADMDTQAGRVAAGKSNFETGGEKRRHTDLLESGVSTEDALCSLIAITEL